MPAQSHQTSVIAKKEADTLVCPVLEQLRRHEGWDVRLCVVFGFAVVRVIHRWLVEDVGRVRKIGRRIHAGVMWMRVRVAEQGCGGCQRTKRIKVV